MNIDDELRAALRREPAPANFATSVLTKARRPWHKKSLTLSLAAVLAAVAIVPGVVLEYRRREEVKGLKAERDLLIALAITRDQLRQARDKVQHIPREIQ
jgi:hypothetical protein